MVKHIVFFKINADIAEGDKRVARAFDALRALPEKIDTVRSWEMGRNFSDRPIAVDYSLFSAFADKEELAGYIEHPAHQEVVGLLREVCTWQVCDYLTD